MTGAVLVLALAPWMTVSVRADEAEDKAVKAIKKLGGYITRKEKRFLDPEAPANTHVRPVFTMAMKLG
jgi:hypothetical protein